MNDFDGIVAVGVAIGNAALGFFVGKSVASSRDTPPTAALREARVRCEVNRNPYARGHCPNYNVYGCETNHCADHCRKYCRCGVGEGL